MEAGGAVLEPAAAACGGQRETKGVSGKISTVMP
eukprot:SAG31_NODE_55_length_29938_cov_9.154027_37_plen_34_part_00